MIGQRQVGFIEGTDGSDVFPVVVEEIALNVIPTLERGRNKLLAEVGGAGVLGQQIKEGLAAKT